MFGRGSVHKLSDELKLLGASRAAIICGPGRGERSASAMKAELGPLCVGVVAEAVQHVPLASVRKAQEKVIRSRLLLLLLRHTSDSTDRLVATSSRD